MDFKLHLAGSISAILFFLFTIWHSAFAASEESEWTKGCRAVDEINKKSGKRILKWVTNERTSYVDVYYPDLIRIPGGNFEISRTEVTQAQWFVMMGNKPSHFSNCGADCPVENVSWDDIQAYLQKLRDMTGMQYRLPTEAE